MAETKYIRTPRGSAVDGTPVALAFRFQSEAVTPVDAVDLSWSADARRLLTALASEARRLSEHREMCLPTASAVAALSAGIPDVLGVARNLRIADDKDGSFLRTSHQDRPERFAARALGLWANRVLVPWATDVGVHEQIVAEVQDILGRPEVVVAMPRRVSASDDPAAFFDSMRDAIAAIVGKKLEGHPLFDGLPAVRRVIGRARSNDLIFETYPLATDSGVWSMRAVLTIGTDVANRPGVILNASRRRYLGALPPERDLRAVRSLTGTIMSERRNVAVEFPCMVRSGALAEPSDPAFLLQAIEAQAPLAQGFAEAVARGPREGSFIGIPYNPRFASARTNIGSGVTERDLIDLATAIEAYSDVLLRRVEVSSLPKRFGRGAGSHKTVSLSDLLVDVAQAHGAKQIDDETLVGACRTLFDTNPRTSDVSAVDAEAARETMKAVRAFNQARIARIYSSGAPTVVIFALSEQERDAAEMTARRLFGDAVTIVTEQLPSDTHGLYTVLPGRSLGPKGRFGLRVAAWRRTADALRESFGSCHALVQVSDFAVDPTNPERPSRREDKINKPAGRHALAVHGNANVQYLLPPGRDLGSYVYRMQSALADLLFGHAASVADINPMLAASFPDVETRPTSIIGFSAIGKSRRYRSQKTALLIVATKIDVGTGRTSATLLKSRNGLLTPSDFRPFIDVLKEVSGLDGEILSPPHEYRSALFQSFVDGILRNEVEKSERPLVLVDATYTRSLWPSLRNGNIGKPLMLRNAALDPMTEWPGVRIVRIADDAAPRVLLDRKKNAEVLDPDSGRAVDTISLEAPSAPPWSGGYLRTTPCRPLRGWASVIAPTSPSRG
jgi:hypothetical protein